MLSLVILIGVATLINIIVIYRRWNNPNKRRRFASRVEAVVEVLVVVTMMVFFGSTITAMSVVMVTSLGFSLFMSYRYLFAR